MTIIKNIFRSRQDFLNGLLFFVLVSLGGTQPVFSQGHPGNTESPTATPDIGRMPPKLEIQPGQNPLEMVKVFINFKILPGADEEKLVKSAGGNILNQYHIIPTFAAEIPLAAVEHLKKLSSVFLIEPVVDVYAVDAELDQSWGVKHINSMVCHAGGNKSDGVKIAVIDSGIDYTHPDLDANYAGGYDFINSDIDPMDDHGHGTHVAGIIAAEDNSNGVVGVAPKAKLYALKVLAANGGGSYNSVIAALDWCVLNNIQITNNSYGSSVDPGYAVEAAFNNAAQTMLHVAAVGNAGSGADTVIYPAKYQSVVAVAATDPNNMRASFSSTGSDVELAAPGISIFSTYLNGAYAYMSGTSMASPHAAGVAALIIKSGMTDPASIRSKLQTTAVDLGVAGRDNEYGFGLVNPVGASSPSSNSYSPVVTILQPVEGGQFIEGELITFTGSALDTEEGDITTNLEWSSNLEQGTMIPGTAVFQAYLHAGYHTITAKVLDAGGLAGSAERHITVIKILANDDTAVTNEDTPITINVLANDAANLTITAVTTPSHGTAVKNGDQTITYTPGANYNGSDSFFYSVRDANGLTDSALVTITINPVNDNPVTNPDTGKTTVKKPVVINVLANDSDVDGDPLKIISVTKPAHGTVTTNSRTVTYQPNNKFTGIDTFLYTISDGNGGTAQGTATVTVSPK